MSQLLNTAKASQYSVDFAGLFREGFSERPGIFTQEVNLSVKVDFSSKKLLLSVLGLSVIVAGLFLYFLVFSGSSPEDPIGQLADCLSKRGAIMYGLPTCPHCQDQKDKFGEYFDRVEYINCEDSREKCIDQGVSTVPTWLIDGKKIVGTQELEQLAEKAGCEYP